MMAKSLQTRTVRNNNNKNRLLSLIFNTNLSIFFFITGAFLILVWNVINNSTIFTFSDSNNNKGDDEDAVYNFISGISNNVSHEKKRRILLERHPRLKKETTITTTRNLNSPYDVKNENTTTTTIDNRRELTTASSSSSSSSLKGRSTTESFCQLEVSTLDKVSVGRGSKVPILLKAGKGGGGWERPTNWTETIFPQTYGHHPLYLKNEFVQPYYHRNNNNKKKNYCHHRQNNNDDDNNLCVLPGRTILQLIKFKQQKKKERNRNRRLRAAEKEKGRDILYFTNNIENPELMNALRNDYKTPSIVQHINGFEVLSIVPENKSHSFHKHGESWLGQVEGRRQWWFLPPSYPKKKLGPRVNACNYREGTVVPPKEAITCIQEPGDIIWFPKNWYHATCALDDWTLGIGAQQGPLIRQQFPKVPYSNRKEMSQKCIDDTIEDCLGMMDISEARSRKS